jgi:hypothetical protein
MVQSYERKCGSRTSFQNGCSWLTLSLQTIDCYGDLETMNNALMQMFNRIGAFKTDRVFTNSTVETASILDIDVPPRERVTEFIYLIKN